MSDVVDQKNYFFELPARESDKSTKIVKLSKPEPARDHTFSEFDDPESRLSLTLCLLCRFIFASFAMPAAGRRFHARSIAPEAARDPREF